MQTVLNGSVFTVVPHTIYYFCVSEMKWKLQMKFGFLAVKSELVMIQ